MKREQLMTWAIGLVLTIALTMGGWIVSMLRENIADLKREVSALKYHERVHEHGEEP